MDLLTIGFEHFKRIEAKKEIDKDLRRLHTQAVSEILRLGDLHLLAVKWDLVCPKNVRKDASK